MENLSTILKRRRKELGLTLAQIAEQMGVAEATVQRWESGNIKSIRYDKIGKLAEILQVNPVSFMDWDYTMKESSNIMPMPKTYNVPRLGVIACGEPILAEQNIECYDAVPDYIKCDFTLVCKGDSMINARIFDGDIVCIQQQSIVESGEIAAVLVGDEEATLKRVHLYEDHIILEPANPMYKPLVFWGEDMNNVRILGKATHFISVVR